tara:strand:- start:429 stop:2189 length:1761 start_codon:yes stop_codon:yes gene_type:complete
MNIELYNKHDLFEKLKNTPVPIESSLRDVLMNYLRGVNFVKVVINFEEVSQGVWNLTLYDINNTGSTPDIVTGQLLYVVGEENRNADEAGKLGVHGVGLDQFIAKITTQQSIDNGGGIKVLTHRHNTNGNGHFQLTGANPWRYGSDDSTVDVDMRTLDLVGESEIDFVDGLEPTENYLAIEIPGVNFDTFDFSSKENTTLEVMANMVATDFVKALDDKVISFHFRKTDILGNTESIDVTEGAKFVDEYGNFKSYGELPVQEFVTSKEHKYVGRFIQSRELNDTIKQEAKRKGYRIFGVIPELNRKHADDWRGYVIDTEAHSGVILGEFGEGRNAGIPYSIMFCECPVANVITDTNKNSVKLASSRKYRVSEGVTTPVVGLDGKKYRPVNRIGDINKFFKAFGKQCNPTQQFKETSRRDLGRRLLMGELPYSDDKFTVPAISPALLKEYLSVYKMDLDSDLDKISFPKEVNFFNGRTILDQVVNNGVTKIANEWKKKESDVKWHQIISEIHGFKKEYGSFPTHFIISADSEAESIPMDYSSNFGEDIKSIVEDLKDSYPDITFQLVDTRYFTLNKKYNYFKTYKQEN